MTNTGKVAILIIFVMPILFFACRNERCNYPDMICGDWISVESDHSWIRFDSLKAVFNIRYEDKTIHDTSIYIYINTSGRGVIPITDESCPVGAIEFHLEHDKEEMIVVGDDYNVQALFIYHMVPGDIPRDTQEDNL